MEVLAILDLVRHAGPEDVAGSPGRRLAALRDPNVDAQLGGHAAAAVDDGDLSPDVRPGFHLGDLDAIGSRDLILVRAGLAVLVLAIVVTLFLFDVLRAVADPRLRARSTQ